MFVFYVVPKKQPPPETLVTDMYNLLRDYLDTGYLSIWFSMCMIRTMFADCKMGIIPAVLWCSDEGLPFSWICTGTSFNHVIVRYFSLKCLNSKYKPINEKKHTTNITNVWLFEGGLWISLYLVSWPHMTLWKTNTVYHEGFSSPEDLDQQNAIMMCALLSVTIK